MRVLYTILCLFAIQSSFAQIQNAGFEDWENINTWNLTPVDWQTGNNQLQEPVTQDMDAYEGDYAMKVTSVGAPLGEYAEASTIVDIDYIPASLDFYAKTLCEFGAVRVRVTFYNGESEFSSHEWFTAENFEEWTLITIPLTQNEPVLTHAKISVIAEVGDLIAGDAIISVDAMGFGITNGINTRPDLSLSVYPNPANQSITIDNASGEITNISVHDITGRLVKQSTVNTAVTQLDVSALPIGVYTVLANLRDGNSSIQKLVINR